jgi:hypothetical protein
MKAEILKVVEVLNNSFDKWIAFGLSLLPSIKLIANMIRIVPRQVISI